MILYCTHSHPIVNTYSSCEETSLSPCFHLVSCLPWARLYRGNPKIPLSGLKGVYTKLKRRSPPDPPFMRSHRPTPAGSGTRGCQSQDPRSTHHIPIPAYPCLPHPHSLRPSTYTHLLDRGRLAVRSPLDPWPILDQTRSDPAPLMGTQQPGRTRKHRREPLF